jgi:hypothetical protein
MGIKAGASMAWRATQVEMLCADGGLEVELRASNCEDKAANENLKRHKILSTVGLSLLLILVSL